MALFGKSHLKRLIFPEELARAIFPSDSETETKLLPKLDVKFRQFESKMFASQGSFSGSPWQPLSPRYAKWKRSQVGRKKILVFSGAMRDSLRQKGDDDHVARYDRDDRVVYLGTKSEVASYHEDPGTRADLPRRSPVSTSSDMVHEYSKIVLSFLIPRYKRHIRNLRALARSRK